MVAEVEKVTVEVETYVGSNKFLAAIATPVETALKAEATKFVTDAKAVATSGGTATADAAAIAKDLRASGESIISAVKATVAPTVTQLGGSGSMLHFGINAAWATFGPQIEAFVLGLL